jgi:hypothetical protein
MVSGADSVSSLRCRLELALLGDEQRLPQYLLNPTMLMELMGGSIALVPSRDANGSSVKGSTFRLRLMRAPAC